MKHPEIVIRRPENEGIEFIKAIMRIDAKHGWRHTEQRTDKGFTFHYFVKEDAK